VHGVKTQGVTQRAKPSIVETSDLRRHRVSLLQNQILDFLAFSTDDDDGPRRQQQCFVSHSARIEQGARVRFGRQVEDGKAHVFTLLPSCVYLGTACSRFSKFSGR
jgi:hypothetical protein